MATQVPSNAGDGSLEILRHLKDAEDSGETRLAQAKTEATKALEEVKAHAVKTLQEHRLRSRGMREARVAEGLTRARTEAEGIVGAARSEASKVTQLNLLDVEMLFPDILDVLFGEFHHAKPKSNTSR